MEILSKEDKQTVFSVYNSQNVLSILGKDISELLKIDGRSKSESERLLKSSIIFHKRTIGTLPDFKKALSIFGYEASQFKLLLDNQGRGIESGLDMESALKSSARLDDNDTE